MNSNRKLKNKLTEQDLEILTDLVIDQVTPGTILRDFNCLIDYIKTNEVAATKSTNYISINHLTPINNCLSTPIKIGLKRPLKKSYPNISGLFLLLRSIGIMNSQYTGRKLLFTINEKIYKQWSRLNDTESYFTLLETWLIRSNPKDLLDESRSISGSLLETCLDFFLKISARGLQAERNKDLDQMLKYRPGLYNLALFEMFGFIEIVHGEPESGKGWRIKKIKRKAIGDAFFKYLYEKLICTDEYSNFSLYNCLEIKSNIQFGQLQKYFVNFFPDWKANLGVSKPEFRKGLFTFRVSIEEFRSRIRIQSDNTLEDLANVILDSVDFDKDHLYAFYSKDQFGNNMEINCPDYGEEPSTDEIQLGSMPIDIGSVMNFVFDFGDDWKFEIQLEEIIQSDLKLAVPQILETHGDPPDQYPDWDDDFEEFI